MEITTGGGQTPFVRQREGVRPHLLGNAERPLSDVATREVRCFYFPARSAPLKAVVAGEQGIND